MTGTRACATNSAISPWMSASSACCAVTRGRRSPLTGKVFDTLVYFVEHAGETLDKDVLLRSIWPGVDRRGEQPHAERLDAASGAGRDARRESLHRDDRPQGLSIRREGHAARCEPVVAEAPRGRRRGAIPCTAARQRGRMRLILAAGAVLFIAVIAAIAWSAACRLGTHKAAPVGGPDAGDSSLQAVAAGRAQRIARTGHDGIADLEPGSAQPARRSVP